MIILLQITTGTDVQWTLKCNSWNPRLNIIFAFCCVTFHVGIIFCLFLFRCFGCSSILLVCSMLFFLLRCFSCSILPPTVGFFLLFLFAVACCILLCLLCLSKFFHIGVTHPFSFIFTWLFSIVMKCFTVCLIWTCLRQSW